MKTTTRRTKLKKVEYDSGFGRTWFYVNGKFLIDNRSCVACNNEDFFNLLYEKIKEKYIIDDDELFELLLSMPYFEDVFNNEEY